MPDTHNLSGADRVQFENIIDTYNPDTTPTSVLIRDIERDFVLIPRAGYEAAETDTTPKVPEWALDTTIRATGNPMLWYVGTDKRAVRLDDVTVPNSMGFPHGREAQIALALVDISASRLHKVTR